MQSILVLLYICGIANFFVGLGPAALILRGSSTLAQQCLLAPVLGFSIISLFCFGFQKVLGPIEGWASIVYAGLFATSIAIAWKTNQSRLGGLIKEAISTCALLVLLASWVSIPYLARGQAFTFTFENPSDAFTYISQADALSALSMTEYKALDHSNKDAFQVERQADANSLMSKSILAPFTARFLKYSYRLAAPSDLGFFRSLTDTTLPKILVVIQLLAAVLSGTIVLWALAFTPSKKWYILLAALGIASSHWVFLIIETNALSQIIVLPITAAAVVSWFLIAPLSFALAPAILTGFLISTAFVIYPEILVLIGPIFATAVLVRLVTYGFSRKAFQEVGAMIAAVFICLILSGQTFEAIYHLYYQITKSASGAYAYGHVLWDLAAGRQLNLFSGLLPFDYIWPKTKVVSCLLFFSLAAASAVAIWKRRLNLIEILFSLVSVIPICWHLHSQANYYALAKFMLYCVPVVSIYLVVMGNTLINWPKSQLPRMLGLVIVLWLTSQASLSFVRAGDNNSQLSYPSHRRSESRALDFNFNSLHIAIGEQFPNSKLCLDVSGLNSWVDKIHVLSEFAKYRPSIVEFVNDNRDDGVFTGPLNECESSKLLIYAPTKTGESQEQIVAKNSSLKLVMRKNVFTK